MIKKILKYSNINFRNKQINSDLERISYDTEIKNYQMEVEKKKYIIPSLSAVYRVKNASLYIESSILSIAPICQEIIIVDNNSSDDTLDKVKTIKEKLRGRVDIQIYKYTNKLAIAGINYKNNLNEHNSLARFYEFSFSKATSDYVMKCDAHLIYNPSFYFKVQKMLEQNRRVIIFRGIELYGKSLPFERYIFKNNNEFYYKDGSFYEELIFKYKLSKIEQFKSTIINPSFIHYKRLNYIYIDTANNIVDVLYK